MLTIIVLKSRSYILAEGGVAPEALSMALSVDVLANDPVVVSLDSESLEEPRESYCAATWAAPAAPADSPVNQDLSNTPQPFKKMRRPRFPPRNVPRENICYKCSREIFVLRPLRGRKRISCNACNAPFHEKCFYSSVVRSEDGVGPCCLEAQQYAHQSIYISIYKNDMCIVRQAGGGGFRGG